MKFYYHVSTCEGYWGGSDESLVDAVKKANVGASWTEVMIQRYPYDAIDEKMRIDPFNGTAQCNWSDKLAPVYNSDQVADGELSAEHFALDCISNGSYWGKWEAKVTQGKVNLREVGE